MLKRYYKETENGLTRYCTDPWRSPYINADGTVKPCCWIHESFGDTRQAPLAEILSGQQFLDLRESLLTGALRPECATCVDRPLGTLDKLAKEIGAAHSSGLNSQRLETITITVTEDCNLRCVYCLVSGPTYHAQKADKGALLKLADDLVLFPVDDIVLNGHGETTFYRGWAEVVRAFRKLESKLSMTSNLSLTYDDEGIEALASLDRLIVSVDSVDRDEQLKIRKGSDIRTVIYNLTRVMASWGDRANSIIIQTVISREAVASYENLVTLFLRLGVREFWICNLVEYSHAKGAITHVASITDRYEFEHAIIALARGVDRVATSGGKVVSQAGLMDAIEAKASELDLQVHLFRDGDNLLKILVNGGCAARENYASEIRDQREWLSSRDPTFEGYAEGFSPAGNVTGWIVCNEDHDRVFIVEVVLDGLVVGIGRADIARDDVAALHGSAKSGFSIATTLPGELLAPKPFRRAGIFVRIAS